MGTGKTTLARYFLGSLPANTATAVVLYPALSAVELLRSILDDFHVPVTGSTLKDHVDALHRFLLEARSEGRDVVLLIDEAQDLAADVLEQVRLLSNLETDTEKLIQIVLMGQSELRQLLERTELRQLAQRVTARYHLEPLSQVEISEYVRHRLAVAGGEGKVAFTANALEAVHQLTAGIPRLVNSLCDRALLAGFVKGLARDQRGHGAAVGPGSPGAAALAGAFPSLGVARDCRRGRGPARGGARPAPDPASPRGEPPRGPPLGRPHPATAHARAHPLPRRRPPRGADRGHPPRILATLGPRPDPGPLGSVAASSGHRCARTSTRSAASTFR